VRRVAGGRGLTWSSSAGQGRRRPQAAESVARRDNALHDGAARRGLSPRLRPLLPRGSRVVLRNSGGPDDTRKRGFRATAGRRRGSRVAPLALSEAPAAPARPGAGGLMKVVFRAD
jgi:hypothetical protein